MKKLTALILSLVMVFSLSVPALAMDQTVPFENTAHVGATTKSQLITNNIHTINITNTGIFIDDVYYSREEFNTLLACAYDVHDGDANIARTVDAGAAGALVAGTFMIPGIGEVIITTVGTIIVLGVVVEAGTWLYNTIVEWFQARAVEKAYENAKENGEPTDNHSTSTGSSLPPTGSPNSSKDLKDSQGVKQRRYYDKNGNADMDIDYRHGGTGHTFPHRHDWNNGVRGPAY